MYNRCQHIMNITRNVNRLRVENCVCRIRYFHNSQLSRRCILQKTSPLPIVFNSSLNSSSLLDAAYCENYTVNLYSSGNSREMTDPEVKRAIDNISEKFSEAMELMNDARSSHGTVYFSEDVVDTQEQVEETLADYKLLLSKLNEKQRKNVIQSIGLKMEELKAQMSLLDDLAKD